MTFDPLQFSVGSKVLRNNCAKEGEPGYEASAGKLVLETSEWECPFVKTGENKAHKKYGFYMSY